MLLAVYRAQLGSAPLQENQLILHASQVASSGTYKTWICLLSGDDQAKIKSTVTSSSDVNFVNIPLNVRVTGAWLPAC